MKRRLPLSAALPILLITLPLGVADAIRDYDFRAVPLDAGAWLHWINGPAAGEVMIRHSDQDYPANEADGDLAFQGPIIPSSPDSALVTGLVNAATDYFTLFMDLGPGFAPVDTTSTIPVNESAHYVDLNGSNTYPYTSPEDAATTINTGISVLSAGDTLWIGAGDYYDGGELEDILVPENVTLTGFGGMPHFGNVIFPADYDGYTNLIDLHVEQVGTEGTPDGPGLQIQGCRISADLEGSFGQDQVTVQNATIDGNLMMHHHISVIVRNSSIGGGIWIGWQPGHSCRIEGCEVGTGILVYSFGIHLEDVHAPHGTISLCGGEPKGPDAAPSCEKQGSRDVTQAGNCTAQDMVVGGDGVIIHGCVIEGVLLGFGSSAAIRDSEAQTIEASANAWDATVNGCVADDICVSGTVSSGVEGCISYGRISLETGYQGTIANSTAYGGISCWPAYVSVNSSTCYGDLAVHFAQTAQVASSTCIGGPVSIGLSNGGDASITNNTIVGPGPIGILVELQASYYLDVLRNVVVGHDIGVRIDNAGAGVPVLSCNNVWDCDSLWVGVADPTGTDGNISADPLFCSLPGEIFTLHEDSPCAEENNPGCGQIGAFPVGCGPSTDVELVEEMPSAIALLPIRPNPGSLEMTITFELPEAQVVTLGIFDVTGRLVMTLVDNRRPAGRHVVTWDGRATVGRPVTAGAYYVRMVADDFTEARGDDCSQIRSEDCRTAIRDEQR